MKKSIGLYADTRNFRTTLPQTKHLNFFMQTNPQGYANGGQVRAGIPQSNMKVTSGFLPMALGYQDGGEPFSFSELYRAIVKVTAEYLGKSEDDPQVQEEAEKIAKTEEGQELAKKILTGQTIGPAGSGMTEPPLPTETFEGSTQAEPPFGAVDVTPDPVMKPEPKITGQTPPGPAGSGIIPPAQDDSGITSLQPKEAGTPPMGAVDTLPSAVEPKPETEKDSNIPFGLGFLDINKDGKIDMKDYEAAIEQGLPKRIIDAILRFLGQIPQEDAPETPESVDVPKQDGPVDTIPSPVKPKEKPKVDDEKKIEIKPKPEPDKKDEDKGVSSLIGPVGSGIIPKISKEEAQGTSDDIANLTGNQGKKEIPEWALPLASAGFAMMASKSPYFLQALGEAGQAGIATLQEQRGKQAEKAQTEAETDLKKAQAQYYRGEGRQTTGAGKTFVQNGVIGTIKNGVFTPVTDSRTGKPLKQKIGREEAIEILTKNNPSFVNLDPEVQNQQITALINLYNNTDALVNKDLKIDEGGGFDLGGFLLDSLDILFNQ